MQCRYAVHWGSAVCKVRAKAQGNRDVLAWHVPRHLGHGAAPRDKHCRRLSTTAVGYAPAVELRLTGASTVLFLPLWIALSGPGGGGGVTTSNVEPRDQDFRDYIVKGAQDNVTEDLPLIFCCWSHFGLCKIGI